MDEQLSKYLSGELSKDELRVFLERIENDHNLKTEFIRNLNRNAISATVAYSKDREEGIEKYKQFRLRVKQHNRRSIFVKAMRYAAVAILIVASTVFSTLYLYERELGSTMNTLHVPAGQRAQITLEDGTKVWLNAQSTLKYPSHFSSRSRKVEVTGEAFFDVAKKSKPFIVYTNDLELHVLGTEFNVYSYSDGNYIQTDLVEGSLKVINHFNDKNSVLLKSNQKMVYKDSKMTVSPITDPDHILWREGIYSFQNERLIDIIEKLQLYYDVNIIVVDPDIFNIRYTGKFRQRDGIDEILRIFQKIQSFKIVKDKEKNIITLV